MCHIVHSTSAIGAAQRTSAFADVAVETMYGLLRDRGITPRLCVACVYGGGNMFPSLVRDAHVGSGNARWALDALGEAGIRILFHDVGGNAYRRLSWTVGTEAPSVIAVPP